MRAWWNARGPATRRHARRAAIGIGIVVGLALLVVAAFPIGLLRDTAERRLSERFGRPVTIGTLERGTLLSFHPVIRVADVRVPQASWAGEGEFARIDTLEIRIRTLPLLIGRFSPSHILARGIRLNLVRDADGRTNWDKPDEDEDATGGDSPLLDGIDVDDAVVRYTDARRERAFAVNVRADDRGVHILGDGQVRGSDVRIAGRGGAVTNSGALWPFAVVIRGSALAMGGQGVMRAPLDTDHMTLRMTARASSFAYIDSVIEAGLPGTQAVDFAAFVEHDADVWRVHDLTGTVGTSRLTGDLTVARAGERIRIDGRIRAARLDFADLSDDAAQSRSRAREAREGPRIVPGLRVDLANMRHVDGRLDVAAARVFSKRGGSSTIRSLSAIVTLDDSRLVAEPLRLGLARGAITGRVVVDQRDGRARPSVALALDLRDSSVAAIAGGADVSGRVDGRVRLTGSGETIRDAVGNARGTIGMVARDGALPQQLAVLMGFDAGRALLGDTSGRARLRCAVARLNVRDGVGTFDPLIVDTSESQSRGTGTVRFPAETVSASVTGAPKGGAVVRVPGSVRLAGTLSDPTITVPREVRSVGNILRGIGDAISGNGPRASDANCGALSSRALGG